MPKLEDYPSQGRDRNNGEDSGAVEEQYVPPLNDFCSPSNFPVLQWREEPLHCFLHGPEIQSSSSSQLALNGSQCFQQVYGSGSQASAFQNSVEEPFEFVTNVTPYCHHETLESEAMAENRKREVAVTPKTSQDERQMMWPLDGDGSDILLLPSGAKYLLPCICSSEQSRDSASASNIIGTVHSLSADCTAREPTHSLSGTVQASQSLLPEPSALLSNTHEPLQWSAGLSSDIHSDLGQGAQIHTEQHSQDLVAEWREMEDGGEVFAEDGQETLEGGNILVLLPPTVRSFRRLILPAHGRRHFSV